MPTHSDYLTYINSANYQDFVPICKVELLDNDEHMMSDYTFTSRIISGTLHGGKNNGIRRTSSIVLHNADGYVTPSNDLFWVNQKYALYLGLTINGEDYYIKQGIFVMDNPVMGKQGSIPVLQINGYDKWALLDGSLAGNLTNIHIIADDTNPNSAIASILALSAVDDSQTLIADSTADTTPYTIQTDFNQTYADIILELTGMLSRNTYYDMNGNLNYRDDIDDSLKPSLFDFNNGTNCQYLGGNLKLDYQNVYNIVQIVGDNINGDVASALVQNENNASPLAIDRIGEKPKPPIEDRVISTDALALIRGKYELRQASRLASYVNFNCYPIYHLDVDQVCRVTDPDLNLDNERVLINGFTINFGNSLSMSIQATRTQELLFSFD